MPDIPEPKSHIKNLKPYAQGKAKVEGSSPKRIIKLASNENPLGPSPKALEAYRNMDSLHRYPDGSAQQLRTTIGRIHGVNAEHVVVGAGSDELINLLIHCYAGPGDEVLYSEHGFLMYKIYATAHGATPVTAKERNLTADVDALLASVTDRTRLLFLANPNNPTGTYLPQSEVARLQAGLPKHVLLVLDAAYAECTRQPDYDCGKALVETSQNTIMLRTLSKIYGLPALRIGWGYGPAHVVETINRVRSPFNVNSAAMAAGIAALEDVAYTDKVVEFTRIERERMTQSLTDMGMTVTPSECNFVLVHFEQDTKNAKAANDFFMSEGIIPREMGGYGLPNALRITIGTQEENDIFLQAMQRFLA